MAPTELAHQKSVAALFGDDGDSQPLWFKKDAFGESTFDTEAYIADLRRFVPFDTLRAELRSHQAVLKHELVELINRDYADFVNLSTELVDVDGAVLRMRLPLNELRGKLLAARESVSESLASLQDGLKRRAEASASREILELLLDTSHVVSKVFFCTAFLPWIARSTSNWPVTRYFSWSCWYLWPRAQSAVSCQSLQCHYQSLDSSLNIKKYFLHVFKEHFEVSICCFALRRLS